MDNKNSVIDFNKDTRDKTMKDPEYSRSLLKVVKEMYNTTDNCILILVERLEANLDKSPENADKLIKISSHMVSVSESLNEVFNTLDSMINDDKEK